MQCTLGNIFGSKCKIVCHKGYNVTGDVTRACEANGKWTGKSSSCQGIFILFKLTQTVVNLFLYYCFRMAGFDFPSHVAGLNKVFMALRAI